MTDIQMIPIDSIKIDGGTQFRVGISEETVNDYAEALKDGAEFPPVIVFCDGESDWLADGFHRLAAAKQAGMKEIAAEVRDGSRRDAILFSLSANANHGLRRTNDDKRKAVVFALRDPELRELSQREIAKLCGVTQAMVSKVNKSIVPKSDNGYHFDTPESVIEALDDQQRSAFKDWMIRGSSWLDDKLGKQFERVGLVTRYGSNYNIERTPLAAQVFEQLAGDDQWSKLEIDLLLWNQSRKDNDRVYISKTGLVKSSLEKLVAGAGWVASNDLGYETRGWLTLLAAKGYVEHHRIQVSKWDTRDYYHITKAGCKLLDLPYSIPFKQPPSAEDLIAEQQARDEAWRREREAREAALEAERLANIDPEAEAQEEREYIVEALDDLRLSIDQTKYLTISRDDVMPLIDQIINLLENAEVAPAQVTA